MRVPGMCLSVAGVLKGRLLLCGLMLVGLYSLDLDASQGALRALGQEPVSDQEKETDGAPRWEDFFPGLDEARLQRVRIAIAGNDEDFARDDYRQAIGEAAKMLYSLGRIPQLTLEGLAATQLETVRLRGRAVAVQRLPLRSQAAGMWLNELSEQLELESLYRVQLVDDAGVTHRLMLGEVPMGWLGANAPRELAEPVEVVGIAIRGNEGTGDAAKLAGETPSEPSRFVLAERMSWYPVTDSKNTLGSDGPQGEERSARHKWPQGWLFLAQRGFDCGQLSGIARRSRQTLVYAEQKPFYEMLRLADELGRDDQTPPGESVSTDRLLRDSRTLVGQWVSLVLESARLSRVRLDDQATVERLGQDHYWQVDAFGELTGVRVELEGTPGGEERLVYENRFPISVAVLRLPLELEQTLKVAEQGAVVDMRMVKESLALDGFYYRLWSYESDFTGSRGARQVAPLIIAGKLRIRSAAELGAGGVDVIGWSLMVLVLGGLAAIVAYQLVFRGVVRRL